MTDLGSKDDLRRRFGGTRRALADDAREAARAAIRAIVIEKATAGGWRCVAAYVPLRSEPGSLELLDGLASLGVRVLVPLTLPDRDLDWTAWPDVETPLGTAAIGNADAILVPALAVAADGTRLGRGGGSYDRALPRRRMSAVTAALLFTGETVPELPRDPWDVPVAAVVTPDGWTELDGIPPAGAAFSSRSL